MLLFPLVHAKMFTCSETPTQNARAKVSKASTLFFLQLKPSPFTQIVCESVCGRGPRPIRRANESCVSDWSRETLARAQHVVCLQSALNVIPGAEGTGQRFQMKAFTWFCGSCKWSCSRSNLIFHLPITFNGWISALTACF